MAILLAADEREGRQGDDDGHRQLKEAKWRPILLLAVLIASLVVARFNASDRIELHWLEKENLQPVRLLHAFLVCLSLSAALVLLEPLLQLLPFRIVALSGRHTLECYAASIVATYAVALVWLQVGRPYLGYLVASAVSQAR